MQLSAALQSFSGLFWDARALRRAGKTDQAREQYAAAARYAREMGFAAEAQIAEAAGLETADDLDEALARLDGIVGLPSLRLVGLARFYQGLVEGRRGNYETAIDRYRKAVEDKSFDSPGLAWNNMGFSYAALGDYDKAIECYQQALRDPTYDSPGVAWNNMGLVHATKGEHDRAIACYQKALNRPNYENPGAAWNNMGLAYMARGDFDEAIECYQQALNERSYLARGATWSNMGLAHMARANYDQAVSCYEAALAEPGYENSAATWSNLGLAWAARGDHGRAISCYERSLADPAYATPGKSWYAMGNALAALGQPDRAIPCYLSALKDRGFEAIGAACNHLGEAYRLIGEHDRAIAYYQRALKAPGYSALGETCHNMGLAHADIGQYDEAIACFQEALDDPDYTAADATWYNMGNAYSERGDHDRAIASYQRALESSSFARQGDAWCNMGLAYARRQEFDSAISCYQRAFDVPGFDGVGAAWYNIGVAYCHKGDDETAVNCWNKALSTFETTGDDEQAAMTAAMIARARIGSEMRCSRDAAWLVAGTEIARTDGGQGAAAQRVLRRTALAAHRTHQAYAQTPSSDLPDVLAIARGFIPRADSTGAPAPRGQSGGYLLKWAGKGLAIDAGEGLLAGMHAAGLHCREIQALAVTRAHPSHSGELDALDRLRYEMAKHEAPELWTYCLLWDTDTAQATVLDPQYAAHRRPQPIAMDLARRRGLKTVFINLGEIADLPFDVGYFEAKHSSGAPGAVGLRIECYDPGAERPGLTLGYTGNTGFYPELCDADNLGGCDILILHVGETDPREYTDATFLQASNLGLRGAERLVRGCEPKLTILGDLPPGLWELQVELVRTLRGLCHTEAILPGSAGLLLDPRTRSIRCTTCGRWSAPDQIAITRPTEPFGPPGYLCRECRV